MKEHFEQVDADIIGIAECDAFAGPFSECIISLIQTMAQLGYAFQHFDKCDNMTGQAIFYKKDKFRLLKAEYQVFDGESSDPYFLLNCLFCLSYDPSFRFVFAETHLKPGIVHIATRT